MADFYDSTYVNFAANVYADVRAEAYGEDLGQNSWLTADERRLSRFVFVAQKPA